MTTLSRRRFVKSAAAVPLALWLARNARADEPLVRYDASSPIGQEMLQIYAGAVAAMQARSPADPLSWIWQWYTHFVDGNTTKSAELTRLFGSEPNDLATLAGEVWNTCQSHSGQNANHFLPWHRMFVLYFESIIRQVSGRPDFTLPYWNYTSADPALRGVLPPQFRLPNDPLYAVLHRPDRKPNANAGLPIHAGQPGDLMDVSQVMAAPAYSSGGGVQGFCKGIDAGIHSAIHTLVGTNKNMGRVPFAARDPLFWVHHSNIDRLWASWNANGGVNPATAKWAKNIFTFADASGQRVQGVLRDFFDVATLGYTYDALLPPPPAPVALAARASYAAGSRAKVVARAQPAELGAGVVRRALLPVTGADLAGMLANDLSRGGPSGWLVLKNLHTWRQPGVLYHVYLTSTRAPGIDARRYVGAIGFFDAEFHDHGNSPLDMALGENFYSFDVTAALRRMVREIGPEGLRGLAVAFVPGGSVEAGAKPLVATIELLGR